MKLLNTKGLPQAVFEALKRKEYSRGDADISVTELIDSPRVRQLKKRNDHNIEMEADSLLAAFLGTCFHKGIEIGTETGTAERRLFVDVNGWKLSGGMDHYHNGTLTDYKTATTWKTVLNDGAPGVIEDFENQLNVYAHILRANGYPVTKLMIFILFKDWNKGSLGRAKKIFAPYVQSGYPQDAWLHFEMRLWSREQAEEYVLERVRLHQEAEKASDANLPLCTKKEIWNGNRCKSYCAAAAFCSQYQEQSKTGLVKREDESA